MGINATSLIEDAGLGGQHLVSGVHHIGNGA